jgi:hypothetical protein
MNNKLNVTSILLNILGLKRIKSEVKPILTSESET